MFSRRGARDRTPNELGILLDKMRHSGRVVLDLTESNPTRAGIPCPAGVTDALADRRGAVYDPSPFGLPMAREAVAKTYEHAGIAVDPSAVVLTSSTSEAYAFLFKLLCDDGDEVLVPQPSYPLFEHLARLEGVRLVPYPLLYDGEWYVDLASVRAAIGDATRAIVVVHPNNPTGSYLKKDELSALAATGLPIVSDEVFAPYPLSDDPRRATSALEARDALVFALGGLSKMAALPQMKLAWLTVGGPAPVVREALERLELISDAFLSVNTPVQIAAPAILATRHIAANAIRARIARNLAEVARRVVGTAVSLLKVEGGWYATLRLPETRGEQAWALTFLGEDGVYVHPGHFFDFASEAYAVASLLTPEATFAEGIARIVARAG
jgi:aspartate/methionine/tyrosine aminotransferase